MPIKLLLAFLLTLLLFVTLKRFSNASPEQAKRMIKTGLLVVFIAVLLFLAVTGRLHWLAAGVASLLPFLRRTLTLLRFIPLPGRLYSGWKNRHSDNRKRQATPPQVSMTRKEACNILGIREDASHDEIIAAHRRLIQRLHPDRGGSDYLAARINDARDKLLEEQA